MTGDQIYYYNKNSGCIVMDLKGKQVRTRGYSGDVAYEGCVDVHEEDLSIHDYYTIRDAEGEIEYAPTVMFVYRPCEIAWHSVNNGGNGTFRLITMDHMVGGGETVGMLAEGKKFTARYVGTAYYFDEENEDTPTVYMVAAALACAFRYIFKHPREGLLLPEFIDPEEILTYAEDYMPIISKPVSKEELEL